MLNLLDRLAIFHALQVAAKNGELQCAVTRDDVQDPTGQRSNIPGRGFTRGFGIGAQYNTTNSLGGIAGNPINGEVGWAPGAIFQNVLTTIPGNFLWENVGTATSAQWLPLDRSGSAQNLVTLTANTTLTALKHAGKTMLLNAAAGFTVTLPAPTGTGNIYNFFTLTTVTSSNNVIDAKGGDASAVISGISCQVQTTNAGTTYNIFGTASNTNELSMNGTTSGGVLGDFIELVDVGLHQWSVRAFLNSTGTTVTVFANH